MASDTAIAWTDHTFNPWMGCTKVSEGCRNCYAETLTNNKMGLRLWGPEAARQLTKSPWQHVKKWQREAAAGELGNYGDAVLGAKMPTVATEGLDGVAFTPHMVFTGSLMDWAEDRDDLLPHRARLWDVIRNSPDLWFQMLTKRPENIAKFLPSDWGSEGYPNVWLGTTIEDNRVKDRAEHLKSNPARVHFISYEPAIGPLDEVNLDGIEWVIVGGESGPGYRPFEQQWGRDMRDHCINNGIAFFMKQDAAYRTELRTFLVEADGSRNFWKQYPGKLDAPVAVAA